MKKPFKLNAYYIVKMGKVAQCDALDALGLEYNGKAVVFLDGSKHCIDADGDINVGGQVQLLLTNHERQYCKRCDNAFVAGVTYIYSNGEEYLCRKDDSGKVLVDVEHGHMFFCNDYSPKEFTPKVGMIN